MKNVHITNGHVYESKIIEFKLQNYKNLRKNLIKKNNKQ